MTEPKKGGRPKVVITDKMRLVVEALAGFMDVAEIAVVVDLKQRTLERHFRKELATGGPKVKGLCISAMVQNLKAGGSIAQRAAEFLLATRFGWSKYAPPPVPKDLPEKPEQIGKKAQLEKDAQAGNEPEEWGKLLQ